ncbi:MAG: HD domain-containing protein [Bacilli bacterium]|jgi:3'-5' exoribonuclease
MIKDLKDGANASGVYLIKNCVRGVSSSSSANAYLNIVLQDKSGTIDAKKWDASQEDFEKFVPGTVLRIDGNAYLYRDKLQVKVLDAFSVDPNEIDVSTLIIDSPIPLEDLLKQFTFYKDSVKNEDCKKILDAVFKKYYKPFIDYPAAVTCHHDFYHGLIYHTVSMCNLAAAVYKNYPDVDYDILISGCLLHDIGKVVEFTGPIATKYTLEGNLLGHISIGMSIVKEIADENKIDSEVPLLLEHMILSHHGKQEFGSPVLPETREALLLSMIDEMDSKMMVLDKAYKDVAEGETTDRIFALDGRTFYKPHKH